MPIETAADRAVFVSADEFGVGVSYTQGVAAAATFAAIFDNEYLLVDAGEAGVTSVAPALTCRSDDLAMLGAGEARVDDQAVVNGVTYRVSDVRPDGTGMVVLILERA